MANFSAKILNNAVSSLRAQQAIIANSGNNIGNVNTPGYARRNLDLETRIGRGGGQLNIGNGVDIGALTRQVDTFLDGQVRSATSEKNGTELVNQFLQRIDHLFSLSGEQVTVGSALTNFFVSAEDLAADPSSIELRSVFLEKSEDLVDSIRNTYQELANLQDEAGERLVGEVATVNSISAQIAELNARIAGIEGQNNLAADERDRRDSLLKQLSEKIEFTSIENSDGMVTVALSNGFALVSGTNSRNIELTNAPSFAAGTLPQSLSGGVLSYIVYDHSNGAGTAHVDFTNFLKNQGGTIGGLLQVRGYVDPALITPSPFNADGHLVEIASRVEAIAITLLSTINTTYLGPDQDPGTAGHQPSSGDLNGNPPSVYGLFDFQFGGVKDTSGEGLPDDIGTHNIANYSSLLQLAISTPAQVAAALDATSVPGAPTFAPGDGRNMEALAAERLNSSITFATGTFSLTGTFDDAYQETVVTVSNKLSRANLNQSVAASKALSAETSRESFSGVSLDEEFTALIRFQRAYQAAARLVKTAEALMDEVINLI